MNESLTTLSSHLLSPAAASQLVKPTRSQRARKLVVGGTTWYRVQHFSPQGGVEEAGVWVGRGQQRKPIIGHYDDIYT